MNKKLILSYIKSILIILAINFIASAVATLLTSVYSLILKVSSPSHIIDHFKLTSVNVGISYVVMLILTVILLDTMKNKFTYGNAGNEWDIQKKEFSICNSISYVIISLPVNIYFLCTDMESIYKREEYLNAVFKPILKTFENSWITTFFSPQLAFFRLTQNVLLGIVLNILIYIIIVTLTCNKKVKNINIS